MSLLHRPRSRGAAFGLAAAVLLTGVRVHAQSPTRLLRTPSVSSRHIAFAYANNVWIVERAGGSARRTASR